MRSATQALTVLAEIDPARAPALEARLRTISDDLDGNTLFRPCDLPATHFMRFVIIVDHELPALLAWECNHDGHAPEYLARVAREVPAIDRVLECCRDYPARGTSDVDGWVRWMLDRSHRAAAFYTGYRGVPRTQVVNDGAVHDAIRDHIDRERMQLAAYPATEIQRRIAEGVRASHRELDISAQDDDSWTLDMALAIAGALLVLPLLLVIIGPWLVELRHREETEPEATYDRPVHDTKLMQLVEDRVTQNQLTHLVDIKPGWFRLFTVWAVLSAIDVLARVYFVYGELGGITSIHFARGVILRDRRAVPRAARRHRLLFFSNYDGSWESYLGEFIDRAASGLTAVWSNTVGFPRSRFLVGAGARDEEAFKQWTRDHQIATQVWWSGVPASTVQNVRDDIWIRRRLLRPLAHDEATRWLATL